MLFASLKKKLLLFDPCCNREAIESEEMIYLEKSAKSE